MGSVFSSPKPSYTPPPVVTAPAVEEVEEEEKKVKKGRSALLATQGGIAGQEAQLGQTSTRGGLLGNV